MAAAEPKTRSVYPMYFRSSASEDGGPGEDEKRRGLKIGNWGF